MALTILRIARGWTQDDLARATGVANSSISEYERGRKVPELSTLRRLLDAMGYPLGAIDRTQGFIASLHSEAALAAAAGIRSDWPWEPASVLGQSGPPPRERGRALQWEVEQVSVEAGRAVSRLTRLLLLVLSQESALAASRAGPDAEQAD